MKRAVFVSTFFAAGSIAYGIACLDMTPITVTPPADAAPPPIVDAGPDAPDVDNRRPCQKCIETPEDGGGCGDELAACLADPRCTQIYACVLQNGCLEKGSQKAIVICGVPCAQEAGVITSDDPAATLVLGVVMCGSSSCSTQCLPDAGPDAAP